MSFPSQREIDHALYEDDEGEVICLDEVQFLENPSRERIEILNAALTDPNDLYNVYRATLVLAAWGMRSGIESVERLIDTRIDLRGVEVPHRIYDYNNVYDMLAHAIHLGTIETTEFAKPIEQIYRKLLRLYGPVDFEFKLKCALLDSGLKQLLPEAEAAVNRALAAGKLYLASQLLPVIANWDQTTAWRLFSKFDWNAVMTPNPVANIAEALGYFPLTTAKQPLLDLCKHRDSIVANDAERSLSKLMNAKQAGIK